jgi:transcriptional regulator with XRE-family HTH domain
MKRSVIDQLRKAIEDSDESQRAIADSTGIDQGNLNRFVRGERSVSLENFAKLCLHLGLTLEAKSRRVVRSDSSSRAI